MKHKITIVKYMAFSQLHEETFFDKSIEDIKDFLFTRCHTFDILSYRVFEAVMVDKQVLRVPILEN